MYFRMLVLLLALCGLAPNAVAAADAPSVTVSTAPFSGDGPGFVFEGTFTLERFDVGAPATSPTSYQLLAAGTASGTVTNFAGTTPYSGPFTWVKVSVSGSCSGIHVTLGRLVYSDYRGLHGEEIWPDLPSAPWGPFAKWETDGATGFDITGSSGLLCAAGSLSTTDASPNALAAVLNQLLRS